MVVGEYVDGYACIPQAGLRCGNLLTSSLRGNICLLKIFMLKSSHFMPIKLTPINMEARAKLVFKSGDTVRVWSKIEEKGKTRLQAFEGIVLARKHGTKTTNAMFTVRKVSEGVGVERVFPLYAPTIDKIEIVKKSKARRSKLYYIRDKAVKEIRRKMKAVEYSSPKDSSEEAPSSETATS